MNPQNPAAAQTDETVTGEIAGEVTSESLIEEVSIDGMCGVY
ncbi:hypothetical protein BH11ACT8_BH11ACT8_12910 [soil metagenome]